MSSMTSRLAAATMLAGVGTVAMAGAANATESHSHEQVTQHRTTGLVGGLVGAGGELLGGVTDLVGGVVGGVDGVAGPLVGGVTTGLFGSSS